MRAMQAYRTAPTVLAAKALLCLAIAPGPAEAQTAMQREVKIEAMRFDPPTLEAHVGDVITWSNRDPFPHTVDAQAKDFSSGQIPAGGAWRMRVERKGIFDYGCALHPTMRGKLIVK